jgi:hypothetical protein
VPLLKKPEAQARRSVTTRQSTPDPFACASGFFVFLMLAQLQKAQAKGSGSRSYPLCCSTGRRTADLTDRNGNARIQSAIIRPLRFIRGLFVRSIRQRPTKLEREISGSLAAAGAQLEKPKTWRGGPLPFTNASLTPSLALRVEIRTRTFLSEHSAPAGQRSDLK